MKKTLWALTLSGMALASCVVAPPPSSSLPSSPSSDATSGGTGKDEGFLAGSRVMFSEFYLGSSALTRAVEIANYGETAEDLSQYSIRIFRGNATEKAEYVIPLSGNLLPGETYVVAYDKNAEAVDADLLSPDFVCDGSWPLGLYLGNARVDTLGEIGNGNRFADGVIVRKNERRVAREAFAPYDWVRYHREDASNLGHAECPISQERLTAGPKLTAEDFALPYAQEGGKLGAGGVAEVRVDSYGDGDTTVFDLPPELDELGLGGKSFRYQNIDTPETQHGTTINAQPWGYAAADWNNAILRSAKHILIQSVRDGYLTETYGRMLGFVWYATVDDPAPSDYRNLNFETVLNGYSKVAFSDAATDRMMSDGLSYYAYFVDAHEGAAEAGIKVHGERDPNFDYHSSL